MLAERWGKYPHEILNDLTSAQITEAMAFDRLRNDEAFVTKCRMANMTLEQRIAEEMKIWG